MSVTNQQIQASFDQDVRPICNTLVKLRNRNLLFKAGEDDLFNGINGSGWTDARTDGPPHLAATTDWYAFNTIITALEKVFAGTAVAQDIADLSAQWPIVQKLCTRDLNGI